MSNRTIYRPTIQKVVMVLNKLRVLAKKQVVQNFILNSQKWMQHELWGFTVQQQKYGMMNILLTPLSIILLQLFKCDTITQCTMLFTKFIWRLPNQRIEVQILARHWISRFSLVSKIKTRSSLQGRPKGHTTAPSLVKEFFTFSQVIAVKI